MNPAKRYLTILLCGAAFWSAATTTGIAQSTERISINSSGYGGDLSSFESSISANGQFIAFTSSANNLSNNGYNGTSNIFVRDRKSGETDAVSVRFWDSNLCNSFCRNPSISADGRFVAFSSVATDLLNTGDHNSKSDIFVRDRQAGRTILASGVMGFAISNGHSSFPAISANGRFVAFVSAATNLAAGNTNGRNQIYVFDQQTGSITRVSTSSLGASANNDSALPSISADGRFVTFVSAADNLVPNDTNNVEDIFVNDRQTGVTTRVSVSSLGVQGNRHCDAAHISADGRYVAFSSAADNLVPNDTNTASDIFLHDRQTGTTTLCSLTSLGTQTNADCYNPKISDDARYVTFSSPASNVVPGDSNNTTDAYLRDRLMGTTICIGVSSLGTQASNGSLAQAISGDGRFILFDTISSNMVSGDSNQSADIYLRDRDACILGDADGDGRLTFFDIDPFVLAITDRTLYQQTFLNITLDENCRLDCNRDGRVDFLDIDSFVALLTR